jgi:hypothetical protein
VALADVDDGLRAGSVSMSFGFGGARDADHRDIRSVASSVARLLSTRDYFDSYSGQPRMSSVPIRIRAAPVRPIALMCLPGRKIAVRGASDPSRARNCR